MKQNKPKPTTLKLFDKSKEEQVKTKLNSLMAKMSRGIESTPEEISQAMQKNKA